VETYLRSEVSLKRYLHSLRAAETTVLLCERFDLPFDEGWTAGMAHDLAREWEESRILDTARKDGYELREEEYRMPLLLHGRAAAVELRQRYGERREQVLQAVRWHTTGHVDIGALGMALYCADYMEPGRSHIDRQEYERLMSRDSLEEMTLEILEVELERMYAQGKTVVPYSVELRDRLLESFGTVPGGQKSGRSPDTIRQRSGAR
jgi:nicotinate-nucleotide adenylyltransferase